MGCALKGLDAALDALSKEQKAQEAVASKYQSKTKIVTSENSDGVTSVTVSLPSSRQASRLTSRRGSIGKQFSNFQLFVDFCSADCLPFLNLPVMLFVDIFSSLFTILTAVCCYFYRSRPMSPRKTSKSAKQH